MDRQPVQFMVRRFRDVVILLLLYNQMHRCVEYGLKWLKVCGTRGAENAVAVVHATDDKCMNKRSCCVDS